ncbi:MAG: zinc ribbon domain-containing protein [Candidatus Riflebacteria bacterium]|nr:zinc ribbon domain-containing protein [Candidatus Riflebacteria bacterium]
MICPQCGRSAERDCNFCPKCGLDLTEIIKILKPKNGSKANSQETIVPLDVLEKHENSAPNFNSNHISAQYSAGWDDVLWSSVNSVTEAESIIEYGSNAILFIAIPAITLLGAIGMGQNLLFAGVILSLLPAGLIYSFKRSKAVFPILSSYFIFSSFALYLTLNGTKDANAVRLFLSTVLLRLTYCAIKRRLLLAIPNYVPVPKYKEYCFMGCLVIISFVLYVFCCMHIDYLRLWICQKQEYPVFLVFFNYGVLRIIGSGVLKITM